MDKLIHHYNSKYRIKKIEKIDIFELKALSLRSYYHNNILAFGDLLHRIHPLAGQGFNMTIRDLKILVNIINESRRAVGLDEIKTRWHNTYIEDGPFHQWAQNLYTGYEVNHFLSTYFFVSRVVNGWIANQNNEEPKYDSDINRMASLLPSNGEYSPMRLIILQK